MRFSLSPWGVYRRATWLTDVYGHGGHLRSRVVPRPEGDLGHAMAQEIDIEHLRVGRGPQGDRVAAERRGDPVSPAVEPDLARDLHLAHQRAGLVLDGRQRIGPGPRTGHIPAGGRLQPTGFVGPHQIVLVAPAIEGRLGGRQRAEHAALEQLGAERPMQALVLALRLRMGRAAMADADPQPQQPHRQRRPGRRQSAAPRPAVVHEHAVRQAVALEEPRETRLHGRARLVGTRLEGQQKAGVIVENSERMAPAAPRAQRKMALEIHLPQLVGRRPLEPLRGAGLGRPRPQLPMPPQDRRNRGGMEDQGRLLGGEAHGQLAPAPLRMAARSASTAASTAGTVCRGERCGRRDRSVNPAAPAAW